MSETGRGREKAEKFFEIQFQIRFQIIVPRIVVVVSIVDVIYFPSSDVLFAER